MNCCHQRAIVYGTFQNFFLNFQSYDEQEYLCATLKYRSRE